LSRYADPVSLVHYKILVTKAAMDPAQGDVRMSAVNTRTIDEVV
jgi:hypothetical protein